MNKHTPGPWMVLGKGVYTDYLPSHQIVYQFHQSATDEEAEANARLIAAAPDLLEAAKDVLADHKERVSTPNCGPQDQPNRTECMDALRAAIAKATEKGRP